MLQAFSSIWMDVGMTGCKHPYGDNTSDELRIVSYNKFLTDPQLSYSDNQNQKGYDGYYEQ